MPGGRGPRGVGHGGGEHRGQRVGHEGRRSGGRVQRGEGALGGLHSGHHLVGAVSPQGNFVCFRDVSSNHRLILAIKVQENMPCDVQSFEDKLSEHNWLSVILPALFLS